MFTSFSLTLGLVLTSLAVQTAKPDFSGSWQLDQRRSSSQLTHKELVKLPKELVRDEPPPPPPPPAHGTPPMAAIEHRGPQLSLPGWGHFGGKTLHLTTDGKEHINDFGAEGKHRSKAVWQGNQMVIDWVHESATGEVLMKG